jgi:hypothetical protein
MSWGAQSRSKDAKTPSTPRGRSENPEPGLWPAQPYPTLGILFVQLLRRLNHRIEFLVPLVAVCCAAYLFLERLGESWIHGAYEILNVRHLLDHLWCISLVAIVFRAIT